MWVTILPVGEHHVPGELLSLQQQVLNCSLCLSGLSLQSCSGICQFLCHDSEETTQIQAFIQQNTDNTHIHIDFLIYLPLNYSVHYLLARNLLLQTSHWILIRSSCSAVCARLLPRASFSKISWFFSRDRRSKWYWRSSPTDATSSFFSSRFT